MWKCSVVIRKDTEEEEKVGVEAGVWGAEMAAALAMGMVQAYQAEQIVWSE